MRRAVQYILEDAISDAIIRRFLVSGDSATIDFQECDDDECNVDGVSSFFVVVCRARDNETLTIEIEESCRDMEAEDVESTTGVTQEAHLNGAPSETLTKSQAA